MATYAIGDLQGCLTPLKRLLDKLQFDPANDRLWFVGDLVNRGPKSLETLRFVYGLGDAAVTVLGNHDLHLLAVVYGIRKPSGKDTFNKIINAPDCEELCFWLRRRPLLHHDAKLGYTLVHAGIHPHWSLQFALSLADELQEVLPSDDFIEFLHNMYGNTPASWSNDLGKHKNKHKRRRFAVNVFTRMRYCYKDGTLNFDFNGPPSKAPKGLVPWYQVRKRIKPEHTILFGHWSSHPAMAPGGVMPLDRGCLWGGSMAAYELESGITVSKNCG